jgi:hypothetical protein
VTNAVSVIGDRATSATSYTRSGGPSCLRLSGTREGDGDGVHFLASAASGALRVERHVLRVDGVALRAAALRVRGHPVWLLQGQEESNDETSDVTSSPAGWSAVTILLVLGLLGCLALSMLAFMAAVRVLDIRVRWWRVIAGLLLLRISNTVMTPVLPWVQQVWASVWGP